MDIELGKNDMDAIDVAIINSLLHWQQMCFWYNNEKTWFYLYLNIVIQNKVTSLTIFSHKKQQLPDRFFLVQRTHLAALVVTISKDVHNCVVSDALIIFW